MVQTNGTAVYKARVLYSAFNPIMQYNDRLNCVQNVGQNKNGNGGYINLDSLYEAQANEQGAILAIQIQNGVTNNDNNIEKRRIAIDEVKVYPNPASTEIIISYSSAVDGEFVLYNTMGEIILKTTLPKDNTKTHIAIHDIATGIYHYEIHFAGMKNVIGKLNILK